MKYFDFVTYLRFFLFYVKRYKTCVPKKPIKSRYSVLNSAYLCPRCHGVVSYSIQYNYCHHCGQRLFWEVLV